MTGRADSYHQWVLVGCEAECRRLLGLLAGARDGRSGVLLIRGEAGIGKSTLLDEIVAAADDMSVLRVRGVESKWSSPLVRRGSLPGGDGAAVLESCRCDVAGLGCGRTWRCPDRVPVRSRCPTRKGQRYSC